jgi:hypothetical protein
MLSTGAEGSFSRAICAAHAAKMVLWYIKSEFDTQQRGRIRC